MFFRRYLEYPGRKPPGFLTLTLVCIGTIVLVETLVHFHLAEKASATVGGVDRRVPKRLPVQIVQRSNEKPHLVDSKYLDGHFDNDDAEGEILSSIPTDQYQDEIEKPAVGANQRITSENNNIPMERIASAVVNADDRVNSLSSEGESLPRKPRLLTMVIVMCSSNSENATDDLFGIERQVRQARVSMKSAVYFSTDPIKLIVISNTDAIFPKIQALVQSWPEEQRQKITLEFAASFYPEKYKMMREMFRPCSTQRLFLEQVLPNEDAILYIDTDVIFMRSPGDAWDLFDKFGEKQMIAAAGPSFMFIQRSDDPDMKKFFEFEGKGFNAGILLFNLTRIRNSPHVWEFQILVSSKLIYFDQIMDQDILNFMCNQYPNYCFKLDCEWNFRWSFCANFTERCPTILKNGPFIVHGIGGAFANPRHPKMVRMYEEFDKWNMSEPVGTLINTLQTILPNTTARTGHCSKVPGIDEALLKQLVITEKKLFT